MITIKSVLGNVRTDKKLHDIYQKLSNEKKVERLLLSRMEAQRSRIRRTSDSGTDIAINLQQNSILRHGDVLLIENGRMIIVEYEPEDVLGLKIKDDIPNDQKIRIAIKLGHIIGNLHRPICTKDIITYVPVQSEAEIANIRQMLLPIIDYIDTHHEKIVFEQDEGIRVHAH